MAAGYKGHKVGSRIEQARRLFDESGPDAVATWGHEHGLAVGTIRSWCAAWGKGVSLTTLEKMVATSPAPPPVKGNIEVTWSKRPVQLMEEGPQQSMIKWLDTGSVQALPNDQCNKRVK
jgi:hypothetical protein